MFPRVSLVSPFIFALFPSSSLSLSLSEPNNFSVAHLVESIGKKKKQKKKKKEKKKKKRRKLSFARLS